MPISKERSDELWNELMERIRNDSSILVGSFTKYNLSNVNHIRSLHIVKDNETMSVYCRKTEIVRGYIKPMNDRRRYLSASICKTCHKAFLKEQYSNAIKGELERLKAKKRSKAE